MQMLSYKLRLKTFSVAKDPEETYSPLKCASPRQAVPVLQALFKDLELDVDQEHFIVVVLNAAARVVGYKHISSGTATGTLVTPAQIYRAALVLGGTSVLMAHNHPSGTREPSQEDIQLTRRCRAAGESLGMPLADHIILAGEDEFYSFRASEGWDKM